MIDLSITNDPEWIKQREALWKPIGADFKKKILERRRWIKFIVIL